jgi:hypothetical protein
MTNAQHKAKLVSAFIHSPSNYVLVAQYTGADNCACGKDIKNIFVVSHAGHEVKLGSECINNYEGLDHIKVELEMKHEQAKADRKAARNAEKARLEAAALIEKKELQAKLRELAYGAKDVLPWHEVYRAIHYKLTGKNVNRVKQLKAIIARLESTLNERTDVAS